LRYAGKVGTGFGEQDRRELLDRLRPLARNTSPFCAELPAPVAGLAHFVRPVMVGEVRYGDRTADGHLRHSAWRGLRPDKDPAEVTDEP
jgi:bifunctional non-homologous end joining protein LigD